MTVETPPGDTPGASGAAGSGGARGGAGSTSARGGRPPARRPLWDNLKSIVGAVVVFLVVRAFLVEAFRIPSGSMVPTLLVGDWLFVNKLVYGPHVPLLDVRLPGYAEPRRGDVVVFESPTQIDQPEDPNPTLVKRLWGTPGDTVYMRGGVLHINGAALPQGPQFADNEQLPDEQNSLFDWQRRYGLAASRFGATPAQPTHDNWGPLVVPAQHYFMMGDNRYNSKDSRYWGFVPRDNLRGRPLFVYYSYDPDAGLPYFRAFTEIRWSRIGHWIR
jgi:signal peptidase I